MDGFHSPSNYTENHQISAPESLVFHSSVDHYWPFDGSPDLLPVAASVTTDAASIETTTPNHIILPRPLHQPKTNTFCDDDDASLGTIKEKIASHPSYSKLLDAYIDCHKVGAPPEVAYSLDNIRRENDVRNRNATASTCLGVDPELDEFMETLWHLLVKYKSDLTRPFEEATVFLCNVEAQLRNLGIDEGGTSTGSEGEMDITKMKQDLKDELLRKFGGRISSLKQKFTKKKKGKLPKEATHTLLDWWNSHNTWPYPTDGDKILLAKTTELDPKQINNWFINQRKRHWKPSEHMRLAIMGGLPAAEYTYND